MEGRAGLVSTLKLQSNSLQFLSANSLIQAPPKANWLIKSYLDKGSLTVLFGEPGSMKSFLAIDMAFCIATGCDWHGVSVKQKGSVFYIAGEGFSGLSKRFRAWSLANDVDVTDAPLFVSNRPVRLLEPVDVREVIQRIEELQSKHGQPVLVIIDTLNRNFGPGDENTTVDMTKFINTIDESIRLRYSCSVLIVHHSPLSDAGRARGASALRGATDWEFCLAKQGDLRKLTATKTKDHEPPPDVYFQAKPIILNGWVEEDGEIMSSCVLEKVEKDMVKSKPNSILKGSQEAIFNTLIELCDDSNCNQTLGIHIDIWREASYQAGISKTQTTEAKKKAFQRGVKELKDKGLIVGSNDYWKPRGTRDRDGTFGDNVPH